MTPQVKQSLSNLFALSHPGIKETPAIFKEFKLEYLKRYAMTEPSLSSSTITKEQFIYKDSFDLEFLHWIHFRVTGSKVFFYPETYQNRRHWVWFEVTPLQKFKILFLKDFYSESFLSSMRKSVADFSQIIQIPE